MAVLEVLDPPTLFPPMLLFLPTLPLMLPLMLPLRDLSSTMKIRIKCVTGARVISRNIRVEDAESVFL